VFPVVSRADLHISPQKSATVTNTFNATPCLLIQAALPPYFGQKIIQDPLHNASISSRHALFDLDLCAAKF